MKRLRILAMIAAPVLIAAAAPVAATTEGHAPPLITLGIYDGTSHWRGPTSVGTGPVQFEVEGAVDEVDLSVFSKKPSYSMAQLNKDSEALQKLAAGKKGKSLVAAAKRLESNVTTFGGVDLAATGNPAKATIVLAPGKYLLSDNRGTGGVHLRKLTVTSTPSGARMPKYNAEITMTGKKKFGGATSFPHLGTIKITNKMTSGTRWYAATLLWVKPGTTAKQVSDWLAGRSTDASFFQGNYVLGSDTLSPGRSLLLNFNGVIHGTFAVVCYFPDLDKPGTTFAGNGMVRIVTMT